MLSSRGPLVLLAVAATASPLGIASATPAAHRTNGAVVANGYPYAARCPRAGYDNDDLDRWGMYVCNCTSFVAWALHVNGQRTDWFVRGAMNAWNWPHVARLKHIPVGRKARVRSVAVWPRLAPPFGHVAYVTGIESDGGIDVAEYNLPEAAHGLPFLFDTRHDVRPGDAVFIYVPARPAR